MDFKSRSKTIQILQSIDNDTKMAVHVYLTLLMI